MTIKLLCLILVDKTSISCAKKGMEVAGFEPARAA